MAHCSSDTAEAVAVERAEGLVWRAHRRGGSVPCGYAQVVPGEAESSPPDALNTLAEEKARSAEARGERCVDLSELSDLVQEGELSEDDAQALQDMLEERGL